MVPLYAHRLGRAYGPDNSADALAGALAAGVEGLETDVCLSADGDLVLLHDPWLPLTTGLEGFAHERSGRELRAAGLLAVEDLLAAAPRALTLQLEVKAHADPVLAVRTVDVSPRGCAGCVAGASRCSRSTSRRASVQRRSGCPRGS